MEVDSKHLAVMKSKTLPFPQQFERLSLRKSYTLEDFRRIQQGHIPLEMEDKWFIYFQEDYLYFHRSWTGKCIYRVLMEHQGEVYVIREALVNRDPEQYKGENADFDTALLDFLIEAFLLDRHVPIPM